MTYCDLLEMYGSGVWVSFSFVLLDWLLEILEWTQKKSIALGRRQESFSFPVWHVLCNSCLQSNEWHVARHAIGLVLGPQHTSVSWRSVLLRLEVQLLGKWCSDEASMIAGSYVPRRDNWYKNLIGTRNVCMGTTNCQTHFFYFSLDEVRRPGNKEIKKNHKTSEV